MNSNAALQPLFAASLLLATAAICLTSYTVRSVREKNQIHETRSATLRELAGMQDASARLRSGLPLLEKNAVEPSDVNAAAQKIIPGIEVTVTHPAERAAIPGWSIRPVEITLAGTGPTEVGRLVEYLENQLPPWRLTAFQFNAETTNTGSATLTLQTLVRSAR